jgi:lipoprotein-releasing system permease protein
MILSICIVTGFQKEIQEKVIGFGAHIQITNFDKNASYELRPVNRNPAFLGQIRSFDGVKHVQVFATKAGIIKTTETIEGVVLKGIDKDFNWDFFRSRILYGSTFTVSDTGKSNSVLISRYTSKRLKLKVGDDLVMYFVQQPARVRKFKIAGIYETGLEELDKLFVVCDIRHIQKLNDWKEDQVGGFEILISDFNRLDELGNKVYNTVDYTFNAATIKDLYPQIFDWLKLQDINVTIIIILMLLVAGINMITALLIMILERVSMIGILKAMGATNVNIRRVFLYVAAYLTLTGIIAGNFFGILLSLLQKHFGIIKLSQESYYVPVVPINLEPFTILLLNTGTFVVCVVMLLLPSYMVTKISPVKAITFK